MHTYIWRGEYIDLKNQEQLKTMIRENFEKDQYNNLIGFCEVENYTTCKMFTSFQPVYPEKLECNIGSILVLWKDSNGEFRIDEIKEFYKGHIDI